MKRRFEMSRYTATALVLALALNCTVYYGARLINAGRFHHDLTLPADALIPFLPWTLCVYVCAFFFWAVNYYIAARQDRSESDRFFCTDVLGKLICLLLFILLPTVMTRPDLTADNVWNRLLSIIYQMDEPNNLFPSIHCFASWLCWIGVRKRDDIPLAYRWFSLLMAAAICVSTVTVRQHLLADVISGVLLAELCYLLAGYDCLRRRYSRLINTVAHLI